MYLVQILLPLYDDRGRRLPKRLFEETSAKLAKAHGGVTAYARAPAVGIWKDKKSRLKRDDIVVYEVMTASLGKKLWADRRKRWEALFDQEAIVIRASPCQRL